MKTKNISRSKPGLRRFKSKTLKSKTLKKGGALMGALPLNTPKNNILVNKNFDKNNNTKTNQNNKPFNLKNLPLIGQYL